MKRMIIAVVLCPLIGAAVSATAEGRGRCPHAAQAGHKNCSKAEQPDRHAGHDRDEHARHDHDAKATTLKQKTCPVSGKPIDEGKSLEHEGQTVYFCCADCVGKFKDAPRQYLPALYSQLHPQRVQVKCPVMGGVVNPQVFTEYKGERIYYCCPGCDKKFHADPAKYMKKMPSVTTDRVRCPVTGKPINPRHSIESGGKTVYFCTTECGSKFKADPEKYVNTFRPEAGLLARGATARDDLLLCPVCLPEGGIHKRSEVEMVDHKGLRYGMCGPSCTKAFKADPDKYVKVLQKEMIRRAGDGEPLYTCSMHPSIVQKGPGQCPICAMKLTPVKR